IYFRLGIIYKQQQKFQQSLECFRYIVADPPRPLSEEDIWFQIGHVHEQQKDYDAAKNAYRRVLERDPNHAKVLQQLGWLYHQQSSSFSSQEQAIEYLEKSVASDQNDAQSWYLLGRCYMSQQKYPKAYEAYQQAVYRDGRNPTFWCSIGVLYYQISQYRDALDAYSRAIRLNPHISEVWYDLGTLYESCNNQTSDALDAYSRAADLDPTNVHIKARLALLKGQPTTGLPQQPAGAPLPQDVHPQAYQPGALGGPPGNPNQWGAPTANQPPPGPAPPALGTSNDWNRRLADVQNPAMQPQPINPYEQRQQMPPRQPSPHRPEPTRQYTEPQRPPPPSHRGLSPSPKIHHAAPTPYLGPQSMAQPPPPPPPPPQQPHMTPHQSQPPPGPSRITNPNFGAQSANIAPPPSGGMAGPPTQGPVPPYGHRNSPPPEVRPIIDNAAPSPGGHFSRTPYQHHANPNAPSITSGAPPPASALQAAEAAAREREERPPTAPPKRMREWDDDANMSQKKPSTDGERARLDDAHSRRPSPPDKMPSPQPRRSPSYKPSEAAHHPPSLPSMQHIASQQQQRSPRLSAPPKDDVRREQQQAFEPAARKMDVDEDYEDSGEEEKRGAGAGAGAGAVGVKGEKEKEREKEKGSPRVVVNGISSRDV
ncbi:glucose repression mediator protein, partial [Elasticomyces elasticus]